MSTKKIHKKNSRESKINTDLSLTEKKPKKKIGEEVYKYKKSTHGYQCIGPCYEKNTLIIHPLTLEQIQQGPNPFCPINPFVDKSGMVKRTDDCDKADISSEIKTGVDLETLSPFIIFDSEKFLKIYYNVDSLESAIIWIDEHQSKLTYATIKRMMNCAIEVYGQENLTNVFFIDFLTKIISKYWIRTFVKKLGSQHREDIKPMINHDFLESVLEQYIQKYNQVWFKETNHFTKIRSFVLQKIEQKLLP
jgi:hypothetical protein